MYGVNNTISTYLEANWEETFPGTADVTFSADYPGLDENATYPQIVVDQLPGDTAIHKWITTGVTRIIHTTEIVVYLKPVNETPSEILNAKLKFRNMMSEVDRIILGNRFDISPFRRVELTQWEPMTDRKAIPLVFVSRQKIKCVYYETS